MILGRLLDSIRHRSPPMDDGPIRAAELIDPPLPPGYRWTDESFPRVIAPNGRVAAQTRFTPGRDGGYYYCIHGAEGGYMASHMKAPLVILARQAIAREFERGNWGADPLDYRPRRRRRSRPKPRGRLRLCPVTWDDGREGAMDLEIPPAVAGLIRWIEEQSGESADQIVARALHERYQAMMTNPIGQMSYSES